MAITTAQILRMAISPPAWVSVSSPVKEMLKSSQKLRPYKVWPNTKMLFFFCSWLCCVLEFYYPVLKKHTVCVASASRVIAYLSHSDPDVNVTQNEDSACSHQD